MALSRHHIDLTYEVESSPEFYAHFLTADGENAICFVLSLPGITDIYLSTKQLKQLEDAIVEAKVRRSDPAEDSPVAEDYQCF